MFCLTCQCEFRPGFTHCASCDVPLVERLEPESSPAAPAEATASSCGDAGCGPRVDYCGFLSLDEARSARDLLGRHGLQADISIYQAGAESGQPGEEFWLRVPAKSFTRCQQLLGYDLPEETPGDAADSACSDCGRPVADAARACSHCGARFE